MKVAVGGGAQTVLASGEKSMTRPVVAGGDVYWGERSGGTIKRVPVDGGSPTTVTSVNTVTALAVAGTDVYFADGYLLAKAPLSGGPATTIGTAAGAEVLAVAVDGQSVYFSGDGTVWKVPLAGGPPTTLASNQGQPNAIAVDATSVYWANVFDWPTQTGGQVMKLTPK
jgi:hypothetical protein